MGNIETRQAIYMIHHCRTLHGNTRRLQVPRRKAEILVQHPNTEEKNTTCGADIAKDFRKMQDSQKCH